MAYALFLASVKEQEGDYMTAIELYLKGGNHVSTLYDRWIQFIVSLK